MTWKLVRATLKLREHSEKEHWSWSSSSPALPWPSCEALSKFLNLSEPQFFCYTITKVTWRSPLETKVPFKCRRLTVIESQHSFSSSLNKSVSTAVLVWCYSVGAAKRPTEIDPYCASPLCPHESNFPFPAPYAFGNKFFQKLFKVTKRSLSQSMHTCFFVYMMLLLQALNSRYKGLKTGGHAPHILRGICSGILHRKWILLTGPS